MLFNSLNFAIFLPLVFFLYWFAVKKDRFLQNCLLLVASYLFYAFWDWRFLSLLAFSTLLDFYTGSKIADATGSGRKKWLWLSIIVNLGFLGVFKYYDFFAESFAEALLHFGLEVDPWTLKLVLPVGISFYTFHGLSYVFDIYNGRIRPEKNLVDYSLFVSFFPLLVAGPIERATHLLPQLKNARVFDYSKAADGLRQILWGLFKKIVIADNCAQFANLAFDEPGNYSGSTLIVGAVFFAFQIYADFSGYSDIALGTARLFGIELLRNFSFPYFSRDIAEFWRRWHISLSSWFRDYLYIPLSGSRGSTLIKIRNVFIIFILSGFWHGSNWTFIVWGALNAIYFLPLLLWNKNRLNTDIAAQGKILPSLKEASGILLTFGLTLIAWVVFRSESLTQACEYFSYTFSTSLFSIPDFYGAGSMLFISVTLGIFIAIEWFGREQKYALEVFGSGWGRVVRWSFYYTLIFFIYYYGGQPQQFIYFQF